MDQLHSCVASDLSIWASVGNTRETEEDVHLRPIQFFRRHVVIPQKGFLPLCKSLAAALRPEVTASRRHRLRPFHRYTRFLLTRGCRDKPSSTGGPISSW